MQKARTWMTLHRSDSVRNSQSARCGIRASPSRPIRRSHSLRGPTQGNGANGFDKIRAFSRHWTIATLIIYVDKHARQQTPKTLGDLVAGTLRS